jgi:ribonuclease T1
VASTGPDASGRAPGWLPRTRLTWLLAGLVAVLVLAGGAAVGWWSADRSTADPVPARSASAAVAGTPVSGLPTVRVAELPPEARTVLATLDAHGTFRYSQDGTVFGNFEHLLPARPDGYYHEYTVPTPGSRDRGARRLVVGRDGDVYYTGDHYATFRQVLR